MTAFHLLCATALLTLAASATASSFVGTTDAIGNSLAGTAEASSDATSSLRDDKVVLAARDDAASFVASQGAIRGVRLEAALKHIRQHNPDLRADDLQLARVILSL
ncbi:DUF2388 domain-containing protein [Pseudomonas sp. MBLB4123]|uniref:DUF2388 domain-containing protein n=1 Tax=Pseudomonas sp. MBLB4123 TaxID=3451557 RepID=UPI003F753C9C